MMIVNYGSTSEGKDMQELHAKFRIMERELHEKYHPSKCKGCVGNCGLCKVPEEPMEM